MRRSLVVACALATSVVAGMAAAGDHGFHVDHRIAVGGDGGWDYTAVDPASQHLFLSHGTRVVVVDARTDSILGEVSDTPGVHGIVFDDELGRGFTSNGRDSSVTVFDLKTFATLDRVKLDARNPDAIVYDPASHRVFTFNGGSGNSTAIDAATGKLVGTLVLDGRPEFAASDAAGRMYVNLEDSSAVVAFDAKTLKVLGRWPLAPGEGPSGLAIDRAHHRLFSVCSNLKLIVLDTGTGHVVATVPIGQGVDAVAFDATRQLVFSSNGDGTLTVIHEDDPDHYTVVENAVTQRGGRTLALDEESGTVFIPTAEFGPPAAPTADRPRPRASIVPGSFTVLVVKRTP